MDIVRLGVSPAWHVINEAQNLGLPITIHTHNGVKSITLAIEERVVCPAMNLRGDSCVILFGKPLAHVFEGAVNLFPLQSSLAVGSSVGWLGYPDLSMPGFPMDNPWRVCFFSGQISARYSDRERAAYLIDGLGIRGVSGGPVFCCDRVHGLRLIGTVNLLLRSAVEDGLLPGPIVSNDLLLAHDVLSLLRWKRRRLAAGLSPAQIAKKLKPLMKKLPAEYGPLSHVRVLSEKKPESN